MPALLSIVINPLWDQFATLIPEREVSHPLGCHRPRIADRLIFDEIVGLDLDDVTVDGCIVKAPCGGEAAGKSPVDRGKQGSKRSLLTDAKGIPLGCAVAQANRHDSPFLRPALAKLGWSERYFGCGLPERITIHLDAGYDSAKTSADPSEQTKSTQPTSRETVLSKLNVKLSEDPRGADLPK